MLNTTARSFDGAKAGRIRSATAVDLPAIGRLMQRAGAEDGIPRISEEEIAALARRGELIVLGFESDELIGAACVTKAAGHGHLAFVVVDPIAPEIEARLRAVAGALCEASLCEPMFATSWSLRGTCRARARR